MRLAVNIEHPADLSASAVTYHPTPQAIEFVHHLAAAALEGGGAHALQGPYGAGKSSLAAFALNKLSHTTATFTPSHRAHFLGDAQAAVSEVLDEGGLVPIPIVGAAEPLASRLAAAMKALATSVPPRQRGVALKSCMSLDPKEVTGEQVVLLLTDVSRAMRRKGRAGTLLVIDEFGRHLEHMLATASQSDFDLLQNIAEATGRPDAPLSLVIIQHFGLEHYRARFLGTKRGEWEKVRGRFREIVLNNTETDAAHIASKALASLGVADGTRRRLGLHGRDVPRILKDPEFLAAAQKCQPLHPMTVALLSRLARLLGQQDRTIVGWLTSDMDTGFKAVRAKGRNGWVYPAALFEHFFGDALLVPSNPALAKRFAAIHEAHERVPDDVGGNARTLFRTLAMLNFCGGRGLTADRGGALACLPKGFPFDECIATLTKSSLVVHRRYRNEYAVWEGSDYDVARRVDDAISTMSLDPAAELNRRLARPVLAHGHLIRTGNRRSAQVLWLNVNEPAPPGDEKGLRVLVWIGEGAAGPTPTGDVVGVAEIHALEPHLRESAAIKRLLDEDSELQDDVVAQKELRSRLDFHEGRVFALAQDLLDADLQWCVGGKAFSSTQPAISAAMDAAYPRAFELHNELVNRDRVSGQITLALRKLFEHLHKFPEDENLGIAKFPAERVIYESLLKQTGLHAPTAEGKWLLDLESSQLPRGLKHCIDEIRGLCLDQAGGPPPTIEAIVRHMAARPFGVKRYPVILLCVLVLLSDRDGHELYEDRQFVPHWGPQTLLRLLKAPARFAISAATASPISKRFMHDYCRTLTLHAIVSDAPIAVARQVLQRHAALSIYARRTEAISPEAKEFRRALETAKSPADMLFRTIPVALGFSSLPSRGTAKRDFFAAVERVWAELEAADVDLLARLERVAIDALGRTCIRDVRQECRDLAGRVLADSQMHHGFDRFLKCLVDDSMSDERSWSAGVVDDGLGIPTPITSWSDGHASQAEFLLRRNLLAMQQAGQLLADFQLQDDARPFAVFWPNPADRTSGSDVETLSQRLSAIVREIPSGERVPVIVNLAREFRGAA